MNNKRSYLIIFIVLLVILSTSKEAIERWRGTTAAVATPFWGKLTEVRLFIQSPFTYFNEQIPSKNGLSFSPQEEMARLQLENRMLRKELNDFQEIIQRETWLKDHLEGSQVAVDIQKQHREDLQRVMRLQYEALPARVIFRSHFSWDSSLWINVGKADNALLGRQAISKNSPVVIGTSIVGVVDYVGEGQSRVRLITDSGLTPSVRAVRGDLQNRLLVQQIDGLLERIAKRPDLISEEEGKTVCQKLAAYKELLSRSKESWFLAKGELQGSIKPIWRTQSQTLRGVGFNYDFADAEGPARELLTGKPIDANGPPIPIIKVNDILLTNGLDGVFPPGLQVATVTKIKPLREGDYDYELEAKPTAGNLDDLSLVFVMPSQGYTEEE